MHKYILFYDHLYYNLRPAGLLALARGNFYCGPGLLDKAVSLGSPYLQDQAMHDGLGTWSWMSGYSTGNGSKPCSPGEHQNRWQTDVHPLTNCIYRYWSIACNSQQCWIRWPVPQCRKQLERWILGIFGHPDPSSSTRTIKDASICRNLGWNHKSMWWLHWKPMGATMGNRRRMQISAILLREIPTYILIFWVFFFNYIYII